MDTPATSLPWTLRFTEWQCGHHQQRPDDIPVQSPDQAKAVLWAIACAISQPGSARACLFNDTHGFADIYLTDDHVSAGYASDFNPEKRPADRPVVVLCADEATAAAILAPELKEARDDIANPDLWQARLWDGTSQVDTYEAILTTLTREAVEAFAQVDDTSLDPRAPLFALPPVFHDGAEMLQRLRTVAAEIAAYEAEREDAHDRDQAADLKREEQNLECGAAKDGGEA